MKSKAKRGFSSLLKSVSGVLKQYQLLFSFLSSFMQLKQSLVESDCSPSGPDPDPEKRDELSSFPFADTLTPQSHLNLRTG